MTSFGHIEFEDFEYFQALTVPTSEDGMTQVGRRGRAVDAYYLLNQWTNVDGNDLNNTRMSRCNKHMGDIATGTIPSWDGRWIY